MGKYTGIWEAQLSVIKEAIKKGGDSMDMNSSAFMVAGNRPNSGYSFRLDIKGAVIPTKKGSAVARDLKAVLDKDIEFKKMVEKKSIVIRMSKDFKLEILVG